MKFFIQKWYLAFWLAALIWIGWLLKPAIGQPQRNDFAPRQVVVLHAEEGGSGGTENGRYLYRYLGIFVYTSSSSPGAPVFPQSTIPETQTLVSLADAQAQLYSAGFRLEWHGQGEYGFVK